MTHNDIILEIIKSDAEDLVAKSQKARTPEEYGTAVDIFVSLVMTYLGYVREPERSIEDLINRKEVWRKEEVHAV